MDLLKRTEEYRVETEQDAEALIQSAKDDSVKNGYELTAYTATHKVKKDDDFYLVKLVKVW